MKFIPLKPRLSVLSAGITIALAACDPAATTVVDDGSESTGRIENRLLTDEELASPPPQTAVDLPEAWSDWIVRNHHPVRSIIWDGDFSDLEFLRGYLQGKRVIQLGENGHGVRQFSQAKVRLVKYLHQELGYDVIALESGLFECHRADLTVPLLAGPLILSRCAFPVWHTEEVSELFNYIRETRRTDRPLRLAGFDSQISSQWTIEERDEYLRAVVEAFNANYAAAVDALEDSFPASYRQQRPVGQFAERYAALLDSLDVHRPRIEQAFPSEPLRWSIARQAVWSTTRFIDQLTSPQRQGMAIRDSTMAVNVEFLADSIFPGQRMIVWAHNDHVRNGSETMGEWLRERFGDELYTVGLYMHEGWAANNARVAYEIRPPASPGLEALLNRTGRRFMFIDLANQPEQAGTAWMDREIMTRNWGITPDPLVPREQYDGLLWVHTVEVPEYLP